MFVIQQFDLIAFQFIAKFTNVFLNQERLNKTVTHMSHNNNLPSRNAYGYEARIIQQLIGIDNTEKSSNTLYNHNPNAKIIKQSHQDLNGISSKYTYTHQSGKIDLTAKHQRMPLTQNYNRVFHSGYTSTHFNQLPEMESQKRLLHQLEQKKCGQKTDNKLMEDQLFAQQQEHQFYFAFQICVDIGDGRQGTIRINQNSDPFQEARNFCQKYNLDSYIVPILGKSICEQKQSQKIAIFKEVSERISKIQENRLSSSSSKHHQCFMNQSQNQTHENNQSIQSPSNQKSHGKIKTNNLEQNNKTDEKVTKMKYFNNSRQGSHKNLYTNPSTQMYSQNSSLNNTLKTKKCVYHLSKDDNNGRGSKMSINQISQQIVDKLGKENIILRKKSKSQQKIAKIKKQNQQLLQKQMEGCVFHPKINKLSCRVDHFLQGKHQNQSKGQIEQHQKSMNLSHKRSDRYEQLYENWRVIQHKKQQSRKNSIQQLSFKPQINPISKKIAEKLKSSNICFELSEDSKCKVSANFSGKKNMNRKSVDFSNISYSNLPSRKNSLQMLKGRNTSKLPVGQYLYSQASKRNIRRQKMLKQQQQKSIPNILQKSLQIVNGVRQNRLREVFKSIKKQNHQTLRFQDIKWDELSEVQLIFQPIFLEMKQTNFDLNQQEFVSAGKRLLKYLSQKDKAVLISNRKSKQNNENQTKIKESLSKNSCLMVAKNDLYKQYDIYERGRIKRSKTKDKIDRFRQDRVRKELQQCSFKPQIKHLQQ